MGFKVFNAWAPVKSLTGVGCTKYKYKKLQFSHSVNGDRSKPASRRLNVWCWLYIAVLRRRRARVQIAAATLSGNSLGQTVHTHRASVHQAAKLVAALLRVARVTAGLVESSGSLPPGL